jgi:YebC/PmpR family DNA-binding regulatory protein
MAGHSHWAGIKHKKAANDAKRGKLWSKLSRNIIVAARSGGSDPDMNLSLRYAIDKAKAANMPKDTIEKAVKKGGGELGGADFESILYEGYGPGGAAIMCDILTDNRKRTSPEVKKIFERRGGSLGATNCVAWIFQKKGLFVINADDATEDQIMETALEAGAEDYKQAGEIWEITCQPENYDEVKESLEAAELASQASEITMIPSTTVALDASAGKNVLNLIGELEDHDDVQNVYSNFEVPDEVMAELAAG